MSACWNINTLICLMQGAAWDLIFMANKEQKPKKVSHYTDKKEQKEIQTFLRHTKKLKKGFSNTVSQKKFTTKVAKKIKKRYKKGVLKLSLNSDDMGLSYNRPHRGPTTPLPKKWTTSNYYYIPLPN